MTVEFPHVSEGDVFNAQNNIKPDVLIENNRAEPGAIVLDKNIRFILFCALNTSPSETCGNSTVIVEIENMLFCIFFWER